MFSFVLVVVMNLQCRISLEFDPEKILVKINNARN